MKIYVTILEEHIDDETPLCLESLDVNSLSSCKHNEVASSNPLCLISLYGDPIMIFPGIRKLFIFFKTLSFQY